MDKFTLKDFIERNNPCFSCGKNISIELFSIDRISNLKNEVNLIAMHDHLKSDLEIKYKFILKIKIFYKNNKIIYSNLKALTEYLKRYRLYLETFCKNCATKIQSNELLFDATFLYLLPITLKKESLILIEKKFLYVMLNDFINNKTTLIFDKRLAPDDVNITKIVLPLVKIPSLKNREFIYNKIKTFIIFS